MWPSLHERCTFIILETNVFHSCITYFCKDQVNVKGWWSTGWKVIFRPWINCNSTFNTFSIDCHLTRPLFKAHWLLRGPRATLSLNFTWIESPCAALREWMARSKGCLEMKTSPPLNGRVFHWPWVDVIIYFDFLKDQLATAGRFAQVSLAYDRIENSLCSKIQVFLISQMLDDEKILFQLTVCIWATRKITSLVTSTERVTLECFQSCCRNTWTATWARNVSCFFGRTFYLLPKWQLLSWCRQLGSVCGEGWKRGRKRCNPLLSWWVVHPMDAPV